MLQDQNLNNKINRLHEIALGIACKDTDSTFENLLEMDDLVIGHYRNLQKLMAKVNKIKYPDPSFMKKIFEEQRNCLQSKVI